MTQDDDLKNNLYWHALNFRTATTEQAEEMWQELNACVERLIEFEIEACAVICDAEATCEGIAQRCADRIRSKPPSKHRHDK